MCFRIGAPLQFISDEIFDLVYPIYACRLFTNLSINVTRYNAEYEKTRPYSNETEHINIQVQVKVPS